MPASIFTRHAARGLAHPARTVAVLSAAVALAACGTDPVQPVGGGPRPVHDLAATSAAAAYLPATTLTFEDIDLGADRCGSPSLGTIGGVAFTASFFTVDDVSAHPTCNRVQGATNVPSGTTAVYLRYDASDPDGTGSIPRQISFASPVARVGMWFATMDAGTLRLVAFDRTGTEVGRAEAPSAASGLPISTWIPLTVERPLNEIASVRVYVSFGRTWMDDLSYARLAQSAQAITITSTPPAVARVGDTYAVTATSTGSESPVTFSAAPAGVCTVGPSAGNAASVTLVGAGTCTVDADQAASPSYTAAPQVTQTLAPTAPVAQAITFTSTPPTPALVGGTYAVGATGGASGSAVTFSSLTPTVCTVAQGTVSFAAVGSCRIAADQAGGAAYDAAPRQTQTVAVTYRWTGFLSPVSNLPTVNVANAGRAVPLKFALGGNQGLAVLAAGSPSSQQAACASGAPTGTVDQIATAGASGLQYDAASGQYSYVWKTDKAWAGTCRQLTLTLVDGTRHTATFQFSR